MNLPSTLVSFYSLPTQSFPTFVHYSHLINIIVYYVSEMVLDSADISEIKSDNNLCLGETDSNQ